MDSRFKITGSTKLSTPANINHMITFDNLRMESADFRIHTFACPKNDRQNNVRGIRALLREILLRLKVNSCGVNLNSMSTWTNMGSS